MKQFFFLHATTPACLHSQKFSLQRSADVSGRLTGEL